jgi:hypothetical protein
MVLGRASISAVGGPADLASPESQTDGVTVLAAPFAMRDFPAKRNLLSHGRDLDQFPKFPGTVGNHANPVSANVIGISYFSDGAGMTVDLGEVHNNRDGETLFHSSVETDKRHPDQPLLGGEVLGRRLFAPWAPTIHLVKLGPGFQVTPRGLAVNKGKTP